MVEARQIAMLEKFLDDSNLAEGERERILSDYKKSSENWHAMMDGQKDAQVNTTVEWLIIVNHTLVISILKIKSVQCIQSLHFVVSFFQKEKLLARLEARRKLKEEVSKEKAVAKQINIHTAMRRQLNADPKQSEKTNKVLKELEVMEQADSARVQRVFETQVNFFYGFRGNF